MVDLSVFLLPVRAVQGFFAVIVLGTLAACKFTPLLSPRPRKVMRIRYISVYTEQENNKERLTSSLSPAASDWNHFFLYDATPSSISFLIFCAVWTFLALAYLILAPMVLPAAHHHFAVLAVEAVTMIFWFAGFIALAAGLDNNCVSIFRGCKTAAAGDAFAAFEW